MVKFEDLRGLTITDVSGLRRESDEVIIRTVEGRSFRMLHHQDCCEWVYVEDVCGDLRDIIGEEVLLAEEVVSYGDEAGCPPAPGGWESESSTWTFYKLATIKGGMTIRWYGSSNGYYSESVDFEEIGDLNG